MKHNENCSAPICSCDPNPNYKKEVLWTPGESVCRQQPYQEFQKKQLIINRLVSKGKYALDKFFTAIDLENLVIKKRRK